MIVNMTVSDFYSVLKEMYPDSLSCPWDNDGLMVCRDPLAPVKKTAVALDATVSVIEKAAELGCDTLLVHHPMIFRKLSSLTAESYVGRRIFAALDSGISVISLHTRLDAGAGGVNDCLCDTLGLTNVSAFGDAEAPEIGRIGDFEETEPENFALHVKQALAAPFVEAYVCRASRRIAVLGGGGGDFIVPAIDAGADTIVVGEAGYNSAQDGAEAGINVIIAGHFYTENPVCRQLERLARTIANSQVYVLNSNSGIAV